MCRIIYIVLIPLWLCPALSTALVSDGRPGVPYFGHVLFLQEKVIEDGKVVAVSLAYSDPRSDHLERCSNTIDVFGGLELFAKIPERHWVIVDYELQSILIADGFTGDADVFKVSECPDVETCFELSQRYTANLEMKEGSANRPRSEETIKVNFEDIQQLLDVGRKLVKAARCRGCHSLEGFGSEHAPSLTWKRFKYERGWLENFLQSPYRMRPAMSDVMMLKYTSKNAKPSLKSGELTHVAKYLVNAATARAPSEQFRRELWQNYDCYECHSRLYKEQPLHFRPTALSVKVRNVAESLQGFQICLGCHPFGNLRTVESIPVRVANVFATDLLLAFEKLELNYLTSFLANPVYLEPKTRMPDLGLSVEQINEIRELARQVKEDIGRGGISPIHVYYEMSGQSQQ